MATHSVIINSFIVHFTGALLWFTIDPLSKELLGGQTFFSLPRRSS